MFKPIAFSIAIAAALAAQSCNQTELISPENAAITETDLAATPTSATASVAAPSG